jgi:hypothetical protein
MRLGRLTFWYAVIVGAVCVAARSPLLAQSGPALALERDVPFQFDVDGVVPTWRWGALYGLDHNRSTEPRLWSADRDGKREDVWFSIPGRPLVTVLSVTGGPDGAIAVSGTANSSDSRAATFVAWISPDRKQQTLIRVGPYMVWSTAIGPDGRIWTTGYIMDENHFPVTYNVIRSYDRSGAMLSSREVAAKSDFAHHGRDAAASSYLMTSNSAVGWLTNAGEYIELGFDGRELARFDPPPSLVLPGAWPCGAGLSANGEVLVGVSRETGSPSWWALALDRQARTWTVALPPDGHQVIVAGFDGETPIALHSASDGMRRYTRSTAAGEPGKQQ